jgi:beta-glucuronidase
MFMTEFGADSVPGNLSRSRDLWSEEYHADLLKETFRILDNHPEICGVFPFCFSDYRDPSKHVTGGWDHMNYKGVVSYQRRPKKAFYALKEIYGSRGRSRTIPGTSRRSSTMHGSAS